jgi:hypothetical protein
MGIPGPSSHERTPGCHCQDRTLRGPAALHMPSGFPKPGKSYPEHSLGLEPLVERPCRPVPSITHVQFASLYRTFACPSPPRELSQNRMRRGPAPLAYPENATFAPPSRVFAGQCRRPHASPRISGVRIARYPDRHRLQSPFGGQVRHAVLFPPSRFAPPSRETARGRAPRKCMATQRRRRYRGHERIRSHGSDECTDTGPHQQGTLAK